MAQNQKPDISDLMTMLSQNISPSAFHLKIYESQLSEKQSKMIGSIKDIRNRYLNIGGKGPSGYPWNMLFIGCLL